MKAGMPKVSYPGSPNPGAIPGADRQHPQALEPRVEIEDVREYEEQPYYHETPVKVCGTVTVRQAPTLRSSHRTQVMDVNVANIVAIADKNPKISRLIISATGAAWIGTKDELNASSIQGFFLPPNTVVVFECSDKELWALAGDATATPKISVRAETWAD